MIEEGTHPSMDDPDAMHEFELRALRLGSSDMLGKVVEAYRHGFLTPYAAEIEKYYIPEYESQEKPDGTDDSEEPDYSDGYDNSDDYPDDDGRFDAWS